MDRETDSNAPPLSSSDREAFQEGVRWGREHGLAGGLFRVRTRAVLGRRPLANNTWFMSGLLIGGELSSLGERAGHWPVILAATDELSDLYSLALEIIVGATSEWMRLPPKKVEQAAVATHAIFLRSRAAVTKA